MDYEIDDLDRKILGILQGDARTPFEEIACTLVVSGGTIHVRVNKLRQRGIIKGTHVTLDRASLGFDVCAFVGVHLTEAGAHQRVVERLEEMPEVLEAHYTTGTHGLLLKVVAASTRGLHRFLSERLQVLEGIRSTETVISLDARIDRDISVVPRDGTRE